MFGFLFIDKPEGITSFQCLKKIRQASGIKRCGFVGTLDPLATGLMVFAVGEATKLIPLLEGKDKVYEVVIKLGETSNTYDSEGEIEQWKGDIEVPSRERVLKLLQEDFLGERMQVPPIFSAIHVDGERAYDLARRNEFVELKARPVIFFGLEILSYEWPLLKLSVHCSNGTYVRSLAHDLGEKLQCGGLVGGLRRTAVGEFSVVDAVSLDEVNPGTIGNYLKSPSEVITDMKVIVLREDDYRKLSVGGFLDDRWNELKGDLFWGEYLGQCVGIVERFGHDAEIGQGGKTKLKFKRKLNIV